MHLAGSTYEEVYNTFRWEIPSRFNIAEAVCSRHAGATPDAPALIYEQADGNVRIWSFREVEETASRLANALDHLGVKRGTIVGIHLPQCPESLISHVAVQKLGGIALPLFNLFGPDAIEYRLRDSGALVIITTTGGWERVGSAIKSVETLSHVVCADGKSSGEYLGFWDLVERGSPNRANADTGPDDPAILMYTS
ncbi:MAG: AMP-binding protein, partial [Pseudomonadota bacterium]